MLYFKVTVPPNTGATLRLHRVIGSSIQESGKPLSAAPGVVLKSESDSITLLWLESGHYEFTAQMNLPR